MVFMICLMPLGDSSEELALSKTAKLRRRAFHSGKDAFRKVQYARESFGLEAHFVNVGSFRVSCPQESDADSLSSFGGGTGDTSHETENRFLGSFLAR
jgi:hypothetical protein